MHLGLQKVYLNAFIFNKRLKEKAKEKLWNFLEKI